MPASESIAALVASIHSHRPGATIWGLGDTAHQQTASDHNPDDTPGVVAEQSDSDSLREYRAIDVKIDAQFTVDDAHALVRDITTVEANRRRARYVIFLRTIYRRATGYQPEPYTGSNPHTTHVHVSSHVSDDANGSAWTLTNLGGTMSEAMLNAYVDKYEGGAGETTPAIREVRENWQNMIGIPGLTAMLRALSDQVAALSAKVDALPAATVTDHAHHINAPTTGPVVDA